MAGRRRTLGGGFLLAGAAVVALSVVAWLVSGARNDLAGCASADESIDVMACGLTRLSVGSAALAVGGVALILLALGAWVLWVRPAGTPD